MILYLDTSSLVKLYIEEAHSSAVKRWVKESEIVATCRIAYAESISAFSRRLRCRDLSSKDYAVLVKAFEQDWKNMAIIDFDNIEAGQLAGKHDLRGMDAIHLSAAKLLRSASRNVSFGFSSADRQLNSAASKEGFDVWVT